MSAANQILQKVRTRVHDSLGQESTGTSAFFLVFFFATPLALLLWRVHWRVDSCIMHSIHLHHDHDAAWFHGTWKSARLGSHTSRPVSAHSGCMWPVQTKQSRRRKVQRQNSTLLPANRFHRNTTFRLGNSGRVFFRYLQGYVTSEVNHKQVLSGWWTDKCEWNSGKNCFTVLSGAEERGVHGPSLDRSYFSRLQPISFLFFNPPSSHVG